MREGKSLGPQRPQAPHYRSASTTTGPGRQQHTPQTGEPAGRVNPSCPSMTTPAPGARPRGSFLSLNPQTLQVGCPAQLRGWLWKFRWEALFVGICGRGTWEGSGWEVQNQGLYRPLPTVAENPGCKPSWGFPPQDPIAPDCGQGRCATRPLANPHVGEGLPRGLAQTQWPCLNDPKAPELYSNLQPPARGPSPQPVLRPSLGTPSHTCSLHVG